MTLRLPLIAWAPATSIALFLTIAVLGGATVVSKTDSSPPLRPLTFLDSALGKRADRAPLVRTPQRNLKVKILPRGYSVTADAGTVALVATRASQPWTSFADGVERVTPYGSEAITVDGSTTEQFLTVTRRQGPRTWSWRLSAKNLTPRLGADGSIRFLAGKRVTGFSIAPVAIYDSVGRDVTPKGAHWTLARGGGSVWLKLRLDDKKLPLPYVIDPAITYSSSSTATGTDNFITVSKPSTVQSGDVMIAQLVFDGGDTITVTPPSGWTLVRRTNNSGNVGLASYWKAATGSEPGSYTWNLSSQKTWAAGIAAYAGVDAASPIHVSSGATGTSTPISAASVTTTEAGGLLLALFGIETSTTVTPPAGMTERFDVSNGRTAELSDLALGAPGPTGTKTATSASGTVWAAQQVVIRPPADTTPPTGSVTAPAENADLRGSVAVSSNSADTGSGVASAQFQRSPAGADIWSNIGAADTTAPYSTTFDTTAVIDGQYDLRVITSDSAGNSFTSPAVSVRIDNTSPTGSLTAPAPDAILSGSAISLTSNSDDDVSGVASAQFQRSPSGAGAWTTVGVADTEGPYSVDLDTTMVSDGLYDLRVITTDNAGNAFVSPLVAVRVDNSGPSGSVVSPTESATVFGSVTIVGTADDPGYGVAALRFEYSPIDEAQWAEIATVSAPPYEAILDTSVLADGVYEVRIVMSDEGGNESMTASRVLTFDNTLHPPTIGFYGFTNAAVNDGVVYFAPGSAGGFTVHAEADEFASAASFTFPALGAGWSGGGTVSSAPYEGVYTFDATASSTLSEQEVTLTETSGQTSPASTFGVAPDSSTPSTAITCVGVACATDWYDAAVSVRLSATDSGSGVSRVRYTTDGSVPTTLNGLDYAGPMLISAPVTIRHRAYDGVGNAEGVVSTELRVDTAAPSVALEPHGSGPLSGSVQIEATASDADSGVKDVRFEWSPAGAAEWVEIETDQEAPFAGSFSSPSVADGSYDFRAVATDEVGHVTASPVVTREVDNSGGGGDFTLFTTSPQASSSRKTTTIAVTVRASKKAVLRATLLRRNRQVFSWRSRVKAGKVRLRLAMPSRLVRPGRYTVVLKATRGGEHETRRLPLRVRAR